jgi:hypothetical protein
VFRKIKVSLYLTKHYTMKTYVGDGYIDIRFLDLNTNLSFTSIPLCSRGKSARYPLNWGWVGFGASRKDVEKEKLLTLTRLYILGLPAHSQSLYLL